MYEYRVTWRIVGYSNNKILKEGVEYFQTLEEATFFKKEKEWDNLEASGRAYIERFVDIFNDYVIVSRRLE